MGHTPRKSARDCFAPYGAYLTEVSVRFAPGRYPCGAYPSEVAAGSPRAWGSVSGQCLPTLIRSAGGEGLACRPGPGRRARLSE